MIIKNNTNDYGNYYQTGLYVIMVGYGLIVITQIISAIKKE